MSFLKAEWRKLAMANYEIEAALLKEFIPSKTELDKWNGTTYISLVGFMFMNTRVLGLKIPFHIHFEEVNLRFYVKHKDKNEWKRGVVFIKEIVPKRAITFLANTLYKEHYQTMEMRHLWEEKQSTRIVKYEWMHQNNWQSFSIEADMQSIPIPENSETEFITEHYWGYTKISDHTTFEYEVRHPKWQEYPVKNYQIDVNFEAIYGQKFKELNNLPPKSVLLAEGSEIMVENKREI